MCASAAAQLAPAPAVPSGQKTSQIEVQPAFHPENVPADAVVMDIHGVCSGLGDGAAKAAPCETQITKKQFNTMLMAVMAGVSSSTAPAAQRNFAESYAHLLALADAAQKSGIEKDPQFQELMKIVQVRTMAEAYRQFLQTKADNPAQSEIDAYYQQNTAKFEQIRLERVIIPPATGRRLPANVPDPNKKARDLASQIRERAVKGEDMTILQADAYKALGLPAPPNTDLGTRRRGTLPAALETELFGLKPGEVSQIHTEPAGFTIYRLRTHDVPRVDVVRNEILRDLHQNYVTEAIKAAEGRVSTDLNADFFGHPGAKAAMAHPTPFPATAPQTAAAPK